MEVVHEKKVDEDRCVAFEFQNVKEVYRIREQKSSSIKL